VASELPGRTSSPAAFGGSGLPEKAAVIGAPAPTTLLAVPLTSEYWLLPKA
jgi:hypothetical protein